MASNSSRKSGSSARSTQRKRVHLGTGTTSRVASAHPKAQVDIQDATVGPDRGPRTAAKSAAHPGGRAGRSKGAAGAARPVSAKQLERDRRRIRKRRILRLRVLAVVAAVLLLWTGWTALSHSALFGIKAVDVSGNVRLTSQEIVKRADVPKGATLLGLDRDAVRKRLMGDPWIARVRFSVGLPSTLKIGIVEREPSAVVDSGSAFWFVDGEGRVLAESVPDSATVLPVVRDLPDFAAEPGVVSDSATLRNVLAVLRGLSPDIVKTVRSVSAPTKNETALLTASSIEIMVGEASRLDEKSVLITDIIKQRGGSVVFIDVRSVERPISRGISQ